MFAERDSTPPRPPKPTNRSSHRTRPPSTPVRVTIPSPIHLGLTGYLLPQEYLRSGVEGTGPSGSRHLSTLPTARRPRHLVNSSPVDGRSRCVALCQRTYTPRRRPSTKTPRRRRQDDPHISGRWPRRLTFFRPRSKQSVPDIADDVRQPLPGDLRCRRYLAPRCSLSMSSVAHQ